jgi:site-specific recombinase
MQIVKEEEREENGKEQDDHMFQQKIKKLTNTCITRDDRCITTTLQDEQGVIICQIANAYAAAQQQERLDFLGSFHTLPQFNDFAGESWLIMEDFNTSFKDNRNTNSKLQDLYQWMKINVNIVSQRQHQRISEVIKGQ